MIATMEFYTRGNTRSGQWSTKRVSEALADGGYELTSALSGGSMLIGRVTLEGDRDSIVEQRKDVTRILRVVSQGCIKPVFKLISE